MNTEFNISQKQIENLIFTNRDIQVMVDSDLADMCQVETKVLNQAVKRNIDRFPENFRFQLTIEEANELHKNSKVGDNLRSQIATSSSRSQFVTLNKTATKNISNQLALDVQKANHQYGNFEVKNFNKSHDRFLIIDQTDVFHLGASLKDLGKKWFAFSRLEINTV